MAKAGLRSCLRCIADYRKSEFNISHQDIYPTIEKTEKVVKLLDDARIAISAPDGLGYGVARMYGAINDSSDYQISVFRTKEEACSFLVKGSGLPLTLVGGNIHRDINKDNSQGIILNH